MATLGSQTVGSIVKLNVDGVATNFIVVHQGLPGTMYDSSCNGTWLLMQDLRSDVTWHTENLNDYANSQVHNYLNKTFINLFDGEIKNVIKSVKLPYTNGLGVKGLVATGANGMPASVFLLSSREVGAKLTMAHTEGVALDYFADIISSSSASYAIRIAKFNGTASIWWTRTPANNSNSRVAYVSATGDANVSGSLTSTSRYIRPALILPAEINVSSDGSVVVSSGAITGSVNIGGVQRELTGKGYVNIGGVLRELSDSNVNIGGILKSLKG